MVMTMKRLLCFIIASILLLSTSLCVYADDSYVVKAESVQTEQGETITVPLKLSGNKGLMGFRITIKYPDNQLVLTDVSSGSLTEDGLFNTTITSYEALKGSFDILWSSNKETKEDGTLFLMTYRVKETADDGEYSISVNYSQEDTFNEKYEDVKLSCKQIKVYVGEIVTTTVNQEQSTNTKTNDNDKNKVSDDYLISSVEQIVKSFGTNDINSLNAEHQKTVVEYVNNRVDSYGGGKKYSNFNELKADYLEAVRIEAVRKVIESADPETIVSVSNEVLNEYKAKSFSELPDDKKREAVDKTLQKLADNGADEEGFKHIDSYEDAAKAIDETVKTAKEENNSSIILSEDEKPSNEKTKAIVVIIVIAVLVLALIISLIFIIKRRVKNEKAE